MSRQRHQNDLAEQILSDAGEGCLLIDVDGRIDYANLCAATLLGLPQDEFIGAPHHPLFHHTRDTGEPHLEIDCPLLAAAAGRATRKTYDDYFCRADGSGFDVDYVAVPMHDDEGRPTGAVVTFHESRREAPQSQSEEVLRALVSSLNETPIVLLSRDKSILSIFKEPDQAIRYGLERANVSNTKAIDYLSEQTRSWHGESWRRFSTPSVRGRS